MEAKVSHSLPSTALVIFGVTGDLSRRYLLPALSEICQNSEIKAQLTIVGLSRRPVKAGDILNGRTANLKNQFEAMQMDYQQAGEYQQLKQKLKSLGAGQVIFYFAVPTDAVLPIVDNLGKAGLNNSRTKLLLEKPFGTDLGSAKEIIAQTNHYFKEEQIYRIDHYLAKEVAQNIAVFLGSNTLFRGVWNNQFVEKIEVVAEEKIGVEGRAQFYENTGALKDMVQSHLLQLTALTIMEPCPDIFDFSQMRSRRLAALQKLKVKDKTAIKGQYKGYKSEVSNPKSKIETFVCLELESSDPKWHGVPIHIITGKNLNEKLTEIRIFFKKSQAAEANTLRLRIQPKEGMELELWVKKPGYDQDLQMLPLDFVYGQYFGRLPDAYEQVIVDALRGRANLFASSDEIVASWNILQPLLKRWDKYQLKTYKPGSTADQILNLLSISTD